MSEAVKVDIDKVNAWFLSLLILCVLASLQWPEVLGDWGRISFFAIVFGIPALLFTLVRLAFRRRSPK